MLRDDYQARGTKYTSWTEYKPGEKEDHYHGITQRPSSQLIAVAQGNIEYVEKFTHLVSVISRDGDVEADINTRLAKAAAVF